MSQQTNNVQSGLWIDYDRPLFSQRQWLVSSRKAQILTNIVAVILGLVTPYLYNIVKYVLVSNLNVHQPTADSPPEGESGTHLVTGGQSPNDEGGGENEHGESPTRTQVVGASFSHVDWEPGTWQHGLKEATSFGSLAHLLWKQIIDNIVPGRHQLGDRQRRYAWLRGIFWQHLSENLMRDKGTNLILLSAIVIIFLSWLGIVFAGVFSALIVSDSTCLASSPLCGWYLPLATANASSVEISIPYDRDAQSEANEYVRRCYVPDAVATQCNFFYNQTIGYTVQDNVPCPFAPEMCELGSRSAFAITTGLVDAHNLGINAARRYLFNKTSICAPLLRNETLVSKGTDEFGNSAWNYFYGPRMNGTTLLQPSTWSTPARRDGWEGAGYTAFGAQQARGWNLIPELKTTPASLTFLIFISSHLVWHHAESFDPIFPAHAKEGRTKWPWINSDPRATILACSEQMLLCEPDGSSCWDRNLASQHMPPDDDHEAQIAYIALGLSTTHYAMLDAIDSIGANALNASAMLSQYSSLPLSHEQWKIEAELLFKLSLARLQIDARDIALGSMAQYPGFINQISPDFADLCSTYKFNSSGWSNVGVWSGVLFLALGGLIFLLGYQDKEKKTVLQRLIKRLKGAVAYLKTEPSLAPLRDPILKTTRAISGGVGWILGLIWSIVSSVFSFIWGFINQLDVRRAWRNFTSLPTAVMQGINLGRWRRNG